MNGALYYLRKWWVTKKLNQAVDAREKLLREMWNAEALRTSSRIVIGADASGYIEDFLDPKINKLLKEVETKDEEIRQLNIELWSLLS